ncbi:MAG: hypothetical protein HY207_05525 [Nitrospirae bacterium]|nr:hypothetical protein [Nitrospirota bacterium]
MVRKIKKRVGGGVAASFAVPLAMAVAALAGPRREGRDVLRAFSPAWQLRDFFLDHFDVEMVTTNRPLALDEYLKWPGAADPLWALRAAGDHGAVLTKAPGSGPDDSTIGLGIVPLVARIAAAERDRLASLWDAEFPEVARASLAGIFEGAFGLISGYDRVVFCGPRPARDLNGVIAHLSALVADECLLGGVPLPRSFPSGPDRLLAAIPGMVKV